MCEFIPNGCAFDVDLYSLLERVHEISRPRYAALVNRNRVFLQQGNARSHTARTARTKIQELGGIELLSCVSIHGPFLRGSNFNSIEAVEVVHTEILVSKTRESTAAG